MDRLTLLQVFSPLLTKLTKLELYHDTIRYSEVPCDFDLINGIEKGIFNYPPKDAIALIDKCLSLIEPLKEKGEEIVALVSVEMYYDELGDYGPATESKVKETKEQLFKSISSELMFFEYKLNNLKEVLTDILASSDEAQGKTLELNIARRTPLPEYKEKGRKIETLDIYQSALFFQYLKETGIILPYDPNSLAKFIAHLTGHSEQNVRTCKGFSVIDQIKSDKAGNAVEMKGHPNYNLTKIKTALLEIIAEVDSEITRQNARMQKM